MCIIFATLTWPENPSRCDLGGPKFKNFPGGGGGGGGGGHAPNLSKRACFHTLRSTVYVALAVPEQLPGYATDQHK